MIGWVLILVSHQWRTWTPRRVVLLAVSLPSLLVPLSRLQQPRGHNTPGKWVRNENQKKKEMEPESIISIVNVTEVPMDDMHGLLPDPVATNIM